MFKTYNEQGQVLLDAEKSVFSFIKSGGLTRVLDKDFANNKREYWYKAKRLGINSKMRQGWADVYTPEYCMYYIDVPNAVNPIAAIHYDGLAENCTAMIYMNTGYFDGTARLMFYSNGRLSDSELAKYQIYIFDVYVEKETEVGINLYDKDGNVTFSNRTRAMNVVEHFVYNRDTIMKLSDGDIYQKSSNTKLASITLFPYEMVNYGTYFLDYRSNKFDRYVGGGEQLWGFDSNSEWFPIASLSEIHTTAIKTGYCLTRGVNFKNIPTNGVASMPDNTLIVSDIGEDGEGYGNANNAYDKGVIVENNPPYQGQALLVSVEGLPFPYNRP